MGNTNWTWYIFLFFFFFGGGHKDGVGQTWEDWEASVVGVHYVKVPNDNKNISETFRVFCFKYHLFIGVQGLWGP